MKHNQNKRLSRHGKRDPKRAERLAAIVRKAAWLADRAPVVLAIGLGVALQFHAIDIDPTAAGTLTASGFLCVWQVLRG